MAIANDATVRHQPGGPFLIEHFWNSGDNRSHIDRINPLDGKSPSDGTGAHGVYHPVVEEPAAEEPASAELFYE